MSDWWSADPAVSPSEGEETVRQFIRNNISNGGLKPDAYENVMNNSKGISFDRVHQIIKEEQQAGQSPTALSGDMPVPSSPDAGAAYEQARDRWKATVERAKAQGQQPGGPLRITVRPTLPQGDWWQNDPEVGSDVTASGLLKQGGVGLVKGGIGLAGLPGTMEGLLDRTVSGILEKYPNNSVAQWLLANRAPNVAPTPESLTQRLENVTGPLRQPQNTAEEYAQTAGEFLPAAIGGPEGLAARLFGRVAAPAVASETAGQATKGTAVEPYARFAAGLGAGIVAAPKAAAVAIPTVQELKTAAKAGYQSPEIAAVQIKPQAVSDLGNGITNDLLKAGFRPTTASAPGTFSEIADLRNIRGVTSVAVDDLDAARKALGQYAKQTIEGRPTAEAAAATQAIAKIDQFLPNLRQSDLLAGDAAKANQILQEARGNYGAAARAKTVQTKALAPEESGLFSNAQLKAASTYGGGNINNATRQQLRPLLMNDAAKARGFSPEALAQLQRAVIGGPIGNASRQLGRLAPSGIVGFGMHVPTAIMTGGATLPLTAAAYAAKKAGNAITRNEVQKLIDVL